MSLTGSMYTAANGLNAHGEAINVVSDNIANMNTAGFKSSQARFADVIATTVGDASSGTQGQGSRLGTTAVSFSQGTLLPTGRSTDLALQGNGFFMLKGTFGGAEGSYYSRNGGFNVDENGMLVSADGLIVQGYPTDVNGTLMTQVTDLQVGSVSLIPPRVTAEIDVRANLDSNSDVVTAFSLATPATTSTFGTSVTCYDSRGEPRNIDLYFTNDGGSKFTWYGVVDGADVGGTLGTPTQVGTGSLQFNTDGSLQSVSGTSITANFANATAGQDIEINFGDPTSVGTGTGREGISSYSGASNITYIAQDGNAEGALLGVSVAEDGTINGAFTNGQPRFLGKVAIASFANQQALSRVGGTLYSASQHSGLPAVGPPGVGGRGSIVSGSLEQSNVNLSQEFINLMAYQRGFEANTRSIKAADQMLQELVNLSR